MHRDLKLENLLLASPQDITKVKIADFGLAKKAAESQMETICGTPQYVAPEVIQVTLQHALPATRLTQACQPGCSTLLLHRDHATVRQTPVTIIETASDRTPNSMQLYVFSAEEER